MAKSTGGEQAQGIFLLSLVYISASFYLFQAPWNEKRYRPQIWYTHSPRPYVKCFFFPKSDPEGRQPRKKCCVTWIFPISPRLPCLKLILFINIYSILVIYYKIRERYKYNYIRKIYKKENFSFNSSGDSTISQQLQKGKKGRNTT